MEKIESEIALRLKQGEDLVFATVLSSGGSTPRSSGAKMIIAADASIFGTIGGGLVEAEVIKQARQLFNTKDAIVKSFDLRDAETVSSLDMICGGQMTVLIEYVADTPENMMSFNQFCDQDNSEDSFTVIRLGDSLNDRLPPLKRFFITKEGTCKDFSFESIMRFRKQIKKKRHSMLVKEQDRWFVLEPVSITDSVYIFGAGHVSLQVAAITDMVGFRTVVLDDRSEFANKTRFANADEVIVLDSYENAFTSLDIDGNSYIVIVTRGHLHDKTVLARALKTPAVYIGMIGSRSKRDKIYETLYNEGFTESDIQRVHSPIGISIFAETPEEIAVSIVAELISVRNKKQKPCKRLL